MVDANKKAVATWFNRALANIHATNRKDSSIVFSGFA